jgi:hypothetical protein
MKNSIILLALFISFLNSYSQSNYTVTNNTSLNYLVRLDIADFPLVCDFTSSPPNRWVTFSLRPNSGCGTRNVGTETLQTSEWVYKVTITEFDNCSTSCGGTGSTTEVGSMEPCISHPNNDTDSWNVSCGSYSSSANATSQCTIY